MKMLKTERHLSNHLCIKSLDGVEKMYPLSILSVEKDAQGMIRSYSLTKFHREQEAVIYHDSSLILSEISPGCFVLSEC